MLGKNYSVQVGGITGIIRLKIDSELAQNVARDAHAGCHGVKYPPGGRDKQIRTHKLSS